MNFAAFYDAVIPITIEPERQDLVCFASTGPLPFDPVWPSCFRR